MRCRLAYPMFALALMAAYAPLAQAQTRACGVERWNVKVLLDADAAAVGSRYASDFAEARRTFVTLPVGIEVEVEGVAYWDDDHGQLGASPNDIELHPVLKIASVLNRNDIPRLDLGADPVVPQDVRVWVNTSSNVYHCPGSAYFGNTSRGEYMTESAAVRAGARPAGGQRCR